MSEQQSRTVHPEELRMDALARRAASGKDTLAWIETERDLEAANRNEAFNSGDNLAANRHHDKCERLADAALLLVKLKQQNDAMSEVLKQRIMVALEEAKVRPWRATHLHYKGTHYRVLAHASDANGEELIESVVYDDHRGKRYVLHRDKWESRLESGKPRYQPIVEEAGL